MIALMALFWTAGFLAYANGANDNFKGVATLFGTGTTNYRAALGWATVTTFAGSVCSIALATGLLKTFSGKGLVPDAVASSPEFILAGGLGAALTVMLATVTGFPISTTHSLTGALLGAGLVAVGTQINLSALGRVFFLPLVLSPLVATVLGSATYAAFRWLRIRLRVSREWCICVGGCEEVIPISDSNPGSSAVWNPPIQVDFDGRDSCVQRYNGKVLWIDTQRFLDLAHYISAGTVSFARGLNDTPKIMALLLLVKGIGIQWGMLVVAAAMAVGGLIHARKVAETMSKKITPMNHGQGFTANLVTSILVLFASRLGMPVSTTHVSCGSLFGLALMTKRANYRVVSEIILAWVLTLPIAALLSAMSYSALRL